MARRLMTRPTNLLVTAEVPRPIGRVATGGGAAPMGVYDPPIAAAPPAPPIALSQGMANGYEAATRTFSMNEIPRSDAGPGVAPVYSTSKQWRGIDVYITTDFFGATNLPFISVGIFAVTKGVRVLIATGRARLSTGPIRVVSARFLCDTFDVVISRSGAASSNAQTAQVSVVASDNCVENPSDPLHQGAITGVSDIIQNTQFTGPSTFTNSPLPFELDAIYAINASGAVRFYQVFDQATAPVLGDRPIYSFALPINGQLQVGAEYLHIRRWNNIIGGPSTTAQTYTSPGVFPGTVSHNLWFR
jgi:hypothetical protein